MLHSHWTPQLHPTQAGARTDPWRRPQNQLGRLSLLHSTHSTSVQGGHDVTHQPLTLCLLSHCSNSCIEEWLERLSLLCSLLVLNLCRRLYSRPKTYYVFLEECIIKCPFWSKSATLWPMNRMHIISCSFKVTIDGSTKRNFYIWPQLGIRY